MYGDGEYVVEFHGVHSQHAPMTAMILSPTGRVYTLDADAIRESKPTTPLAHKLIGIVRFKESR